VPAAHAVYALPDVLERDNDVFEPELPSVAAASDSIWLLSDGHGALLALDIPPAGGGDATLLASHDLTTSADSTEPLPFILHAAALPAQDTALAFIVSAARIPKAQRAASGPTTVFTAALLSFSLSAPSTLRTLWRGQASDAPTHVAYHASHAAFLLLSPAPFAPALVPEPAAPAADEAAPVPRAGEALDAPPYQWTQTRESVTITLVFPPAPVLRASAFAVSLSPTHAGVSLGGAPVLPHAPLWDTVADPTWTFDPAAHVLALELSKAHAGTRWPRLFSTGLDVPETLDGAQAAAIAAALDKHTGEFAAPVPSLARGELDDDVDLDGAPPAYVALVPVSADAPPHPQDGTPVALLAPPLPGAGSPPALLTKHGLDGILFALDGHGGAWAHAATFPALAFVLASKRGTRVLHAGARAVLALEARGARNLYLYHGQAGRAAYGRQTIVRVGGGGDGGMLVGVGALTGPRGEKVVLALCEHEIVALRGLLD
jgi:hypothetical protein